MRPSIASLQRRFYPNPDDRSPVPGFSRILEGYARLDWVFLDIGCGAGKINTYELKGKCRKIIGVDVTPAVMQNPLIDEGFVYDGNALPLPSGSVDVVFSIYVQEHVEHPRAFAAEIARVLRPGGLYLSLTPNWSHYVPLIAGLTPHAFHEWFNERRGRPREDTFPTYYRLNGRSRITRTFFDAGFSIAKLDFVEVQPNYLMFNSLAYLLGVIYERVVNSLDWLDWLRVNIVLVAQKRGVKAHEKAAEKREK
jgi:SAM-dependent methyltransferase